jgi:phosphatidylserine decarboxylase
MTVKGQSYTVAQLLGDEADARRYAGGSFFVVYLSPRDYHRVHAPLGGKVSCIRHVGGTLYPVNALGTRYVPGLFARNERVAIFQETESHGQVASVMVGAMGVGRIGLSFDDLETNRGHSPGVRRYGELAPHLDRGEELGVFHLGSTVIVFIGPDSPVKMLREPGVQVRMGEPIARRVDG